MDADLTVNELRVILRLDATNATQHARCGPKANCRRQALAKVDEDLDALAMALPHVRVGEAGAVAGAPVLPR